LSFESLLKVLQSGELGGIEAFCFDNLVQIFRVNYFSTCVPEHIVIHTDIILSLTISKIFSSIL
jgi:hypothetical protein